MKVLNGAFVEKDKARRVMTVRELVEALSEVDQDLPVVVRNHLYKMQLTLVGGLESARVDHPNGAEERKALMLEGYDDMPYPWEDAGEAKA